jgi:hypothetical protein
MHNWIPFLAVATSSDKLSPNRIVEAVLIAVIAGGIAGSIGSWKMTAVLDERIKGINQNFSDHKEYEKAVFNQMSKGLDDAKVDMDKLNANLNEHMFRSSERNKAVVNSTSRLTRVP